LITTKDLKMKLSSLLLPLAALLPSTLAQQSTAYTDKGSGITFQLYTASTGYFFGIAAPENPTTDFIGIIGGKGTGWSGVSLGGTMVGKLLIAAWPNGNTVLSSFRKATGFSSPPVATGTFSMTPIINGTYVNSTHWAYTFLCSKCIDGTTTFKASEAAPVLGWASNTAPPSQKTNAASPISKHASQGNYAINFAAAKSANYSTWASYAAPKPKPVRTFVA
jgi:hypothetical protein